MTRATQVRHFRHEALFYDGMDQFLDSIVPFIREGLREREQILIVVSQPKIKALQGELGSDAGEVSFADMTNLGRNPARLIPFWPRPTGSFPSKSRATRKSARTRSSRSSPPSRARSSPASNCSGTSPRSTAWAGSAPSRQPASKRRPRG